MERRVLSKTSWVLVLWLCVSLACNFPDRPTQPTGMPAANLRQTLAAMATATAQGTALTGAQSTFVSLSSPEAVSETEAPAATSSGPAATSLPAPTNATSDDDSKTFRYYSQSGDTLDGLAGRFAVEPGDIKSDMPLPAKAFIDPGQFLEIPNRLEQTPPFPDTEFPDSALINSPSAADFDVHAFVEQAGGYLNSYSEMVKSQQLSGADIVQLVATESSVSPRFLLALLEYQSGWVYGQPNGGKPEKYPIGFNISGWSGLYKEFVITATHLNMAYYGWRAGKITEMKFTDGSRVRMNPELNAGSATAQHLLGKLFDPEPWKDAFYGSNSYPALYQQMFGDPWARAASVEPLFPPGIKQTLLELPFQPGERWSLTGGPHESWKTGSPRGALDLAPVTGERECAVSRAWVTAVAPGQVVRSALNAVVIDLDGDGNEQTGWTVLYFHVADKDRIQEGAWVDTDDPMGHPSCEGGAVTGTHLHIARKYNGEWIPADGPLPFVMGGWEALAYDKNYTGELRKGDQLAVASPVGPGTSIVTR